jgi:hypothetical protein
LAALESQLAAYVSHPAEQDEAFNIMAIPKISRQQAAAEVSRKPLSPRAPSYLLILVLT